MASIFTRFNASETSRVAKSKQIAALSIGFETAIATKPVFAVPAIDVAAFARFGAKAQPVDPLKAVRLPATLTNPDPMNYPRPQFVRAQWKNLNGPWQFQTDDSQRGLPGGWAQMSKLRGSIQVPYTFETEMANASADDEPHRVLWYKKNFTVPESWLRGKDLEAWKKDNELLLHFGAVDYQAQVWINGIPMWNNTGGHVPFAFDISKVLRKGQNQITVRVVDNLEKDQLAGKQNDISKGIYYKSTTGIWQTAWLEPVSKNRMDSLKMVQDESDPDTINMVIPLHAARTDREKAPNGWTVEVDAIDSARKMVWKSETVTNNGVARLKLHIPDAERWSPSKPKLYDLKIRMKDGQGNVVDEVGSYFGFRTVGTDQGRMMLNNNPIYLKMILDQGYWPQSGMTPPSGEALLKDVQLIKQFGFNGVRKHQKIEDPRFLYFCDRLGLAVWSEMPNSKAWSPQMQERLKDEMRRQIERDYNHPSIIAWVPTNESWSVQHIGERPDRRAPGTEYGPREYEFLKQLVMMIRQLDPSRLVIDNDGWEQTNLTDVVTIHDYSKPKDFKVYEQYKMGDLLPREFPDKGPKPFAQDAQHHGQPVMFTEVGGYLQIPPGLLGKKLATTDPIYRSIYGKITRPEQLLRKYDALMKAIASVPIGAGFCYTQFSDIYPELNGLVDAHRNPKVAPELIANIMERYFGNKYAQPTSSQVA